MLESVRVHLRSTLHETLLLFAEDLKLFFTEVHDPGNGIFESATEKIVRLRYQVYDRVQAFCSDFQSETSIPGT